MSLTKIKINIYIFYSISDLQVIQNFPKKIKNLFPKEHWKMTTQCKNPNESRHKQTGKKKFPAFSG